MNSKVLFLCLLGLVAACFLVGKYWDYREVIVVSGGSDLRGSRLARYNSATIQLRVMIYLSQLKANASFGSSS